MRTEITIVLPLPPRELSPNARVHWGRKATLTKRVRGEAELLATVERQRLERLGCVFPWHRASLQSIWYWPDRRHLSDDDNLIGRCKAVRDGIADAGIVVDDKVFELERPLQLIDKRAPRLEIKVGQL